MANDSKTVDELAAEEYFAVIPTSILYADISAAAVRLYGVLRRFADMNGGVFPSRKLLAERMRVKSPRSVDGYLDELIAIGAVGVQGRVREDGGQSSNLYTVRNALHPPVQDSARGPVQDSARGPVQDSARGPVQDSARGPVQDSAHETEPLETEPNRDTSSSSEPATPLRDDVERMLDYLDSQIVDAGVRQPPNRTKKNRDAARLMLDSDGYDRREIAAVIDWATHDSFWSSNIGSAAKLREKYQTLRAQMNRPPKQTPTTKQERNLAVLDAAEQRWAAEDNRHEMRELL